MTKNEAWDQLIITRPKPPMLTKRRIEFVKNILENDEDFWWDMLDRHGLRDTHLDELDPEVREHCISNFWGQLCEKWVLRNK